MIKRLVKIKEVENKSLNDLINEFIESLEPPEYEFERSVNFECCRIFTRL